jgi:hypothetical protein
VIRARAVQCSLCWLLVVASPAAAAWLTADDLDTHCAAFERDAQSREGAICAAYIQGVIEGERAVNGPATAQEPESFSERAARTRAGSRLRSEGERAWCIDPALPAAAVLERVVPQLRAMREASDGTPPRATSAAWLVQRALGVAFPCSGP